MYKTSYKRPEVSVPKGRPCQRPLRGSAREVLVWRGNSNPKKDSTKKIQDQVHEPIAFQEEFKCSQKNCTTYVKDAYAIVKPFDRLDNLLWRSQKVHIFTTHENLLYGFAPLALQPSSRTHVLSKFHPWEIHLSRFSFSTEHIDGHKNLFADILTRRSREYRTESARLGEIAALCDNRVSTSDTMQIDLKEITDEQGKYLCSPDFSVDDEGIARRKGKI